jgi:luciferase family oxidoreductase group 1
MLPNHEPLVVAEQFALLEAAFPGRIDLGIGRAPGTDPLTRYVLRGGSSAAADDAVTRFPEYVDDIITLMHPDGVEMTVGGRRQPLRATPRSASLPTVWLLGSSDYSARLAASRGLPYVFAHHFSGRGTAEALALYRENYVPSAEHPEPRTFLTVNAVVAATTEEARRLALPSIRSMIALRTGQPLRAAQLVEDAEAQGLAPAHEPLADDMLHRWVIGSPADAASRITALAVEHGVDEVMVSPVAGAFAGTPADRAPAREETLRLLADALAGHRD